MNRDDRRKLSDNFLKNLEHFFHRQPDWLLQHDWSLVCGMLCLTNHYCFGHSPHHPFLLCSGIVQREQKTRDGWMHHLLVVVESWVLHRSATLDFCNCFHWELGSIQGGCYPSRWAFTLVNVHPLEAPLRAWKRALANSTRSLTLPSGQ